MRMYEEEEKEKCRAQPYGLHTMECAAHRDEIHSAKSFVYIRILLRSLDFFLAPIGYIIFHIKMTLLRQFHNPRYSMPERILREKEYTNINKSRCVSHSGCVRVFSFYFFMVIYNGNFQTIRNRFVYYYTTVISFTLNYNWTTQMFKRE